MCRESFVTQTVGMEFQYYGSYDRPAASQLHDQPWWDEEDTLSDRRVNGKETSSAQYDS